MRSTSSLVLMRPLSGMLMRALGVALALALISLLATTALGQENAASTSKDSAYQPVRTLHDPATGTHWLLERNTEHPGAPGRLVQVSGAADAMVTAGMCAMLSAVAPPVIRAGSRVLIVEQTSLVNARLWAVALKPARKGERFRGRLVLGGKVVDAIALDAELATLVSSANAPGAVK
ncbi:MAG: hypothetical protein KGN79_02010 [Acidobacteriota bacterium]|nr:hypothetical protein [Acidobacteriota bacterium]